MERISRVLIDSIIANFGFKDASIIFEDVLTNTKHCLTEDEVFMIQEYIEKGVSHVAYEED